MLFNVKSLIFKYYYNRLIQPHAHKKSFIIFDTIFKGYNKYDKHDTLRFNMINMIYSDLAEILHRASI